MPTQPDEILFGRRFEFDDLFDDDPDAKVHLLVVRRSDRAMYVAHSEARWRAPERGDWWNRWRLYNVSTTPYAPNMANLCRTCLIQLAGTPRPVLAGAR